MNKSPTWEQAVKEADLKEQNTELLASLECLRLAALLYMQGGQNEPQLRRELADSFRVINKANATRKVVEKQS